LEHLVPVSPICNGELRMARNFNFVFCSGLEYRSIV